MNYFNILTHFEPPDNSPTLSIFISSHYSLFFTAKVLRSFKELQALVNFLTCHSLLSLFWPRLYTLKPKMLSARRSVTSLSLDPVGQTHFTSPFSSVQICSSLPCFKLFQWIPPSFKLLEILLPWLPGLWFSSCSGSSSLVRFS